MQWVQAARNSTVGLVVTCPPDLPKGAHDTLCYLLARICKVRQPVTLHASQSCTTADDASSQQAGIFCSAIAPCRVLEGVAASGMQPCDQWSAIGVHKQLECALYLRPAGCTLCSLLLDSHAAAASCLSILETIHRLRALSAAHLV